MGSGTRRRRWVGYAVIAGAVVLFLVAILAFPFYLPGAAGRDWQTLSNVGQAYGVISAVLSGLALCGVVASVTLQWRQAVWARTTSARERHFELMKLMLEDPDLSHLLRPGETGQEHRRKLVNNLWASHWLLLWDVGEVDAQFLRAAFANLFTDAAARDWWRETGPSWVARRTRRHDEFLEIAWNAFRDADQEKIPPAGGRRNPAMPGAASATTTRGEPGSTRTSAGADPPRL
jgi:hypothetical protein